ncbi:Carboxylic ester hydrolase [Colletotrichum asianum]
MDKMSHINVNMTSHEHRDSAASTVLDDKTHTNDKTISTTHVHPQFPTEHYHHTTRPPSTGYTLVSAWWSLELASTAISVGFFATYWWLLAYYDGRPVSHWHGPQARLSPLKNLPAAAAIVMTAFRVFLSYPIAAAMGQLKWHHFARPWPRPVADLQAFDAASRGTFGSARLLLSRNVFHSFNISLGCVLLLGTQGLQTLGQSAITQHASTLNQTEVPGVLNARIPFCKLYSVSESPDIPHINMNGTNQEYVDADPRMQAALLAAWSRMWKPKVSEKLKEQQVTTVPANCSTRTCLWEDITTISVDYQCTNASVFIDSEGFAVSSQANITNRIGLPRSNGSFAHAQIHLQPSLAIPNGSAFVSTYSNGPALIGHLAAIAESSDGGFEAAECAFRWAVATWGSSTYNDDNLSLEQGNPTPYYDLLPSPPTDREKDIVIEAPCNVGHNLTSNEDPGGNKCRYTITHHAHEGLRNFLVRALEGSTYRVKSKTQNIFRSDNTIYNTFQASWQVKSTSPGTYTSLNLTMDGYARQIARGVGAALRALSNDTVAGQVVKDEQIFSINKRYIAYPGCMLGLTIYLLAYAMWRTKGEPTWKTSLLPFLYHGFELPATEPGYHCRNLAWMEEASKQKQVVLRDDCDGLGLKLRNC